MTIAAWLQMAIADARQRGLADLKPLLETLARATTVLRDATPSGPQDPHDDSLPR
jgi:hypothetical protein